MLPLDAMPFRLFKRLFSSFIRPLVKNENWNVLPPARSHEIDYFLRAPECGDHRIEQGSSSLFIAETCCHFLLRSSFSLSEAKNWTGWLLCSFLSLGSIPLCKRGEEEATEYLSKVTWPVRSPIDRKNANLLDQEKPFFFMKNGHLRCCWASCAMHPARLNFHRETKISFGSVQHITPKWIVPFHHRKWKIPKIFFSILVLKIEFDKTYREFFISVKFNPP